jgi:hypothetical protein
MIDIFAALSLANSASKLEGTGQLFSDAEILYSAYINMKAGKLSVDQLASTGQLAPLLASAARITNVANTLAKDPTQMKNISSLLASI